MIRCRSIGANFNAFVYSSTLISFKQKRYIFRYYIMNFLANKINSYESFLQYFYNMTSLYSF